MNGDDGTITWRTVYLCVSLPVCAWIATTILDRWLDTSLPVLTFVINVLQGVEGYLGWLLN